MTLTRRSGAGRARRQSARRRAATPPPLPRRLAARQGSTAKITAAQSVTSRLRLNYSHWAVQDSWAQGLPCHMTILSQEQYFGPSSLQTMFREAWHSRLLCLFCLSLACKMRLLSPAQASEQERALREFTCTLCKGVLVDPLSTPCGHHFCKPCLEARYAVSLIYPTCKASCVAQSPHCPVDDCLEARQLVCFNRTHSWSMSCQQLSRHLNTRHFQYTCGVRRMLTGKQQPLQRYKELRLIAGHSGGSAHAARSRGQQDHARAEGHEGLPHLQSGHRGLPVAWPDQQVPHPSL